MLSAGLTSKSLPPVKSFNVKLGSLHFKSLEKEIYMIDQMFKYKFNITSELDSMDMAQEVDKYLHSLSQLVFLPKLTDNQSYLSDPT